MRIRLPLVVLMFVIGCAKPPTEQIDAAKAAVESARKAEADKYAPTEFRALQRSLQAALDEVDLKNYTEALPMLEEVVTEAKRVEALAKANKEKKQAEAQAKLEDLRTAIARTKESLDKAPTGKGAQRDIERMKNDLATLAASTPEVERAIKNGDLLGAVTKAESTLRKVSEIEQEVQAAIEKKGKGK